MDYVIKTLLMVWNLVAVACFIYLMITSMQKKKYFAFSIYTSGLIFIISHAFKITINNYIY